MSLSRDLLKILVVCLLFMVLIVGNPQVCLVPEQYCTYPSDESNPSEISNITLIDDMQQVAIPPSQNIETIAVIVESSIFPNVTAAISQYRKDLSNTGYQTILYTNPLTSAEELKDLLTNWYETECLIGAVLIGRLPYALFHHDESGTFSPETFICDLFLMDLDGQWSDIHPVDGIYDAHSGYLNTDIYPEIFVGRIDPSCLTWGSGTEQHILNYLSRIHDYRTGGVQRNHCAIAYIDDDWAGDLGAYWGYELGLAYETRTVVRFPTTYTNATDWCTNRLTQNYQWGHLCAHSSPTTHYFGPGGSGEGTVTSSQIRAAPPSFNFYNLFCCSGAKWTMNNNLAVTYTFSGDYSLATIGSSKTGSMMDCDEFYSPLSQNATIGESLIYWFSHSLTSASTAGTEFLEWYYGMNIVGDPLLSINYDHTVLAPHVVSETHPDQGLWYINSQPSFNWTSPPDVNQIVGYYYIIDQSPSTIPTSLTGIFTTQNHTHLEYLDNGIWYFHIVARDSVGNIGTSATHYRIQIDRTKPVVSVISPANHCNLSSSSLPITWTYQDAFSGYSHAELILDSDTRLNTTELSYLIESLSEGTHTLNLTIFDAAGNSVFELMNFRIDLTDPKIISLTINEEVTAWPNVSVVWSLQDILDYRFAEVAFDGEVVAVIYGPECRFLIENSEFGKHLVNLTIFDWSNRTDSWIVEVVVPITGLQYIQLTIGCTLIATLIILGSRWKRQ